MANSQEQFCQLAIARSVAPLHVCQMANMAAGFGKRLKQAREENDLTLESLAEKMDVSFSQISRFESEKREPRISEVLRLAELLHIPWQELVQAETTTWRRVPLISMVNAGKLIRGQSVESLDDAPKVDIAALPAGDWLALRVEGTSMNKISPPDSIIFVNRRSKQLVPNACYVIDDPEEGATYKRYRPEPMRFEPVTTFEEEHKTIFPDQEPKILGRVYRTILDLF